MTCDTTGNCGCAAPKLMCGGVCLDVTSDPANCGACGAKCATGEVCDKSTCKGSCTAPLVDCSGACVDLKTDPLHCGKCDGTCSPLETCLAGTCTKKDADAGTDAATGDGSVDDTGFVSDSGTGTDATVGDGALGDSPTDTAIHGSCGCETPGGHSSSPSSAKWLTLAGLAFLGLRRRKRN
jgi:MYXO-CTERM domain-containing protein